MKAARPSRKPSPSALVAGVFVLCAAGFAWFGTHAGSSARSAPATLTAAATGRPAPVAAVAGVSLGGLPTRVVIPAANIDATVQEVGVTLRDGKPAWETAWRAAGHHLDSALPGQLGNMVITGHVSVADRGNLAVFSQLDEVAAGDVVEVYSGDDRFLYTVNKVLVVPPSAVKLLRSDSTATVTLVTCTKDLKNRLVVVGTLTT